MTSIHKSLQAIRPSILFCHRKQRGPVIPPPMPSRKRSHRHDLQMRHAKLSQMLQPIDRRIKSATLRKRTNMHLVDHSARQRGRLPTFLAPRKRPMVIQHARPHAHHGAAMRCAGQDKASDHPPAETHSQSPAPRSPPQPSTIPRHPAHSSDTTHRPPSPQSSSPRAPTRRTHASPLSPTHILTHQQRHRKILPSVSTATLPPSTVSPVSRFLHRPSGRFTVVLRHAPSIFIVSRGTTVATESPRR